MTELLPENVMTKTTQASTAKTWNKPVLVRLGQIADVAGPKVTSSNGASSGFANS